MKSSMELYKVDGYQFLLYNLCNGITVGFSTSKNKLNFNKNLHEGKINLQNLKDWFHVNEVIYLNQIHGTKVYDYIGDSCIIDSDGDGIVTSEKDTAIGVFTADCVPVILVDSNMKVVSVLHSGWKGTLNNIVSEGIKVMEENYKCDKNNIVVFIGPHNKSCCYEVSEELIDSFKECDLFKNETINYGRNLDLQRCVEVQLVNSGIKSKNIVCTNLCTYCSKDIELYSYRKKEESCGRLFSFVFKSELEE